MATCTFRNISRSKTSNTLAQPLNRLKLTISLLFISFTFSFGVSASDNKAVISKTSYCSINSSQIQLDLSDVRLTREQDIPLMYQGMNNLEGPLWHKGALYYSNMGSKQLDAHGFALSNQSTIWRWIPGTKPQIWLDDSVAGTNGLAIDNKGNLVATRQLDGSVVYIDWQSKKMSPIVTHYEDKRFNSPNDITIADDNTIFFTDPNWNTPSNIDPATTQGGGAPGSQIPGQRVYRVSADGRVNPTLVTELVPALRDKPNGIALSLDQKQLIVGGIAGLWAFELNSGRVSNPKQLLKTPIDGLGKDCSGNIYVTTTRKSANRADDQLVVVLNKNHEEIGTITVPGIHIVTNIAFGGEDGRTLFVTGLTDPMDGNKIRQCGDADCLSAGIYSARLNVQGFPY